MRGLTYQWNGRNRSRLLSRLASGNSLSHKVGDTALFIPLTRYLGAKLFLEKKERNFAHRKQQKAFEKGLGPRVGSKFSIHMPIMEAPLGILNFRSVKVFGYLTQKVKAAGYVSGKEKTALLQKLMKIGIKNEDAVQDRNIGRIKDKLVAVDFDRYTCLYDEWTKSRSC